MDAFGEYLSILVGMGVAAGLAGGMWAASRFVGPRHITREKMIPYECGNDTEGTRDVRFPIRFYLVAILFLLFDVAVVILYPWVVGFGRMGWEGILVALPLLCMIGFGVFYAIRKGAFQWQ